MYVFFRKWDMKEVYVFWYIECAKQKRTYTYTYSITRAISLHRSTILVNDVKVKDTLSAYVRQCLRRLLPS